MNLSLINFIKSVSVELAIKCNRNIKFLHRLNQDQRDRHSRVLPVRRPKPSQIHLGFGGDRLASLVPGEN